MSSVLQLASLDISTPNDNGYSLINATRVRRLGVMVGVTVWPCSSWTVRVGRPWIPYRGPRASVEFTEVATVNEHGIASFGFAVGICGMLKWWLLKATADWSEILRPENANHIATNQYWLRRSRQIFRVSIWRCCAQILFRLQSASGARCVWALVARGIQSQCTG